jgi:hypothetical protein
MPTYSLIVVRLLMRSIASLLILLTAADARPYDDWKQMHFGASATNVAVAGDLADPDHDGWLNAVEYALGEVPVAPSAPVWSVERLGGLVQLLFHRSERTDLTVILEKSATLAPTSWVPVAQSIGGAAMTALSPDYTVGEDPVGDGRFLVKVNQVTSPARCLYRVRSVPASLAVVDVTPASVTRGVGQTQPFAAKGTWTDGAIEDITEQAVWSTGVATTASVSNATGTRGLATALAAGFTSVTATLGVVSGAASFTVTPPVLTQLTVTPDPGSVPVGVALPMTATGLYSDSSVANLTTQVTWSTSTPGILAMSNAAGSEGRCTGLSVGSGVVSASIGIVAAGAIVEVTPAALASITVSPVNPTRSPGQMVPFLATGFYIDSSAADLTSQVTWASSDTNVATVSNAAGTGGQGTAVAAGTCTISAALGTVSGSTGFTVEAALNVSSIAPANGSVGALVTAPVVITFSTPVNPATLIAQTAYGPPAGSIQLSRDGFATCHAFTGTVVMSVGSTVATLTSSPALDFGSTWQVRVTTAVQTPSGSPLGAGVTQSLGFTTEVDAPCAAGLVISQIYGGGGNAGAPWQNDFIELHNPTVAAISTAGLSVQYASATGAAWQVTALPSVSISAGGYFLVRQAAGSGSGAALPTPDATGTIAMSAMAGKVALCNTITPLSGSAPVSAAILDLVGFGAAATGYETAPAPAPSNSLAILRRKNGNVDAGNNSADFVPGPPLPRNAASPSFNGECWLNEKNLNGEADYVAIVFPLTTTATVGQPTETIYARIYEAGMTEAAGPNASIQCQIGYGPINANPQSQGGWTWVPAAFNVQVGNDDEYSASLIAPAVPGNYRYAARFSFDGINWTGADSTGAGSNVGLSFEADLLPTLVVTP